MKTVLMISWSYPPLNSTASKRAGCFAKYLPQYGWAPIVVTPEWRPDNCIYDKDYIKNIPTIVKVHTVPFNPSSIRTPVSQFIKRVKNLVLPHHDPHEWHYAAQKEIENIFHNNRLDMIWATFPMALPHSLAAWASWKWSVPWVADFRDIYGEYKRQYIGDRIKYPIRLFYEKKMIRTASGIVTVSDALRYALENRHRKKVVLIPNGYDPDDNIDTPSRIPVFNITYTGTVLLPQQNPLPVAIALDRLIKSQKVDPCDVSMDFYGTDQEKGQMIFGDLRKFPFVRFFNRVSARECLNRQKSSAVLLQLAHAEEKGIMTGKIFEYLQAGRPILSVPNDGDCIDQLLNETSAGVALTNVDDIADQLLEWYREWKRTGYIAIHANQSAIQRYSRKEHTRLLADLFNQILNGQ